MIRVIKLGGSLLASEQLPACLDVIATLSGQVIIVPGGGSFADLVRQTQQRWRFDDVAAHRMAILAMQQMALVMQGLQPQLSITADWRDFLELSLPSRATVMKLSKPGQLPVIWSPCPRQLDEAGIASSWQISSDSLSAWLAGKIAATELILVKAAEIPENCSLADLQALGIVDEAFRTFTAASQYKITVINQASFCASHD